ncbi:hypothetical protein NDU88_005023 [Pleurodeles waltl]|uniref:Uncharacterized protein n=1 Tax=Pleurodeles waltl TaxID=8319 RepID=A0AAV7UGU1_PLEWA|nr:hypothetical protein NDU88_005023 [Pleurodeles waltl]
MPHPQCYSLQESPAFTGSRGDQRTANVRQSATCFLRRALPRGRQLRRIPCFLFGLGHPGGRFCLSAKITSPVQSPVSPARWDRRLVPAPGGGELMSFIPASYSPVMAPSRQGPPPSALASGSSASSHGRGSQPLFSPGATPSAQCSIPPPGPQQRVRRPSQAPLRAAPTPKPAVDPSSSENGPAQADLQ